MNGLNQILFGLTREGGLGPVHVMGGLDWQAARMWDARLNRFYRLNPTNFAGNGPWAPGSALSFLTFADGQAALIKRFDNPEDPGRNNSHAVVGPADTLATFAPFVSDWPGWIPEPGRRDFHDIDFTHWHNLRVTALEDARSALHTQRTTLGNLVRAVLAHDPEHFAPITRHDPLPLLILAREILDPVLSAHANDYAWTFSTYEDSDTTQAASPRLDGAPRFWCMRGIAGSGESLRKRVPVDQHLDDDDLTALAMELVSGYADDPIKYVSGIGHRLTGGYSPAERIHMLRQESRSIGAPFIDVPAQRHSAPPTVPTPTPGHRQPPPGDSGPDLEATLRILESHDLSPDDRRSHVRHLRALVNQREPLAHEVRRRLDLVNRRLDALRLALAAAVVVLALLTVAGWLI